MLRGYDAWWAASVQDSRMITHKEALAAPALARSALCFDCLAVAMATQVAPGAHVGNYYLHRNVLFTCQLLVADLVAPGVLLGSGRMNFSVEGFTVQRMQDPRPVVDR
jgi:hypothetical protein